MKKATQTAAINIAASVGGYTKGIYVKEVIDFGDDWISIRMKEMTGALAGEYHFSKFAPKGAKILKIHDPVTSGNQIQDVITDNLSNDGSEDLSWSYTYSTSEEQSDTDDISASISASINQSISYGGAASPVAGETQFSLDVSTSYSKTLSHTESKSKDITVDLTVPPHTKLTVSQIKSKGSFKQTTDMVCNFTYALTIIDQLGGRFNFTDEEMLYDVLCGAGVITNDGNSTDEWVRSFRISADDKARAWMDKLDAKGQTVSVTTRFDKADVGSLTTTEDKL